MADGNLEYIQDTQTLIGSRKRDTKVKSQLTKFP